MAGAFASIQISRGMKTLVYLLALTLATTNAFGKVLIYKGNLKISSDTNTAFPKSAPSFLIFDPDQSTLASLTLIEADGNKILLPSSPSDFRFAKAPISRGRTSTIMSFASASGGSNDFFTNVLIRFRGTDNSLTFSSSITGNRVDFPRLLTGIGLQDQSFNALGSFIEEKFLANYQEDRSIIANDGNQTSQQVLDALVAEFKGKGFN